MKKYVWLTMTTIAALIGVLTAGNLAGGDPVEVSVLTLETKTVEKTVSCSGKIEAAESKKVYTDVSCVAGEVLVEAGQKVEKGDVLFTVDVDATKQVLATLGGVSPDNVPDGEVRREVTAPVSGVITTLNAAEGEMTDSGKPCVVISPDDTLQVSVAIHERDIRDVQVGQSVKVSGVAFEKKSYTGTVKSIATTARQQITGTSSATVVDAVVELAAEELDDSLRLGLTAKAQVVVSSSPDALVVPYAYVLEDEEGREYVYLYQNGRAVKRVIQTGDELAAGFQIVEGLQAGDRVIANPDAVPEDGAPAVLQSGKA